MPCQCQALHTVCLVYCITGSRHAALPDLVDRQQLAAHTADMSYFLHGWSIGTETFTTSLD